MDRTLLRLLQLDGRLTNRALAKRLGLSESACWARVRRLETAGVIVGYTAILDPAAVGHAVQAWVEVRLRDTHPKLRASFETVVRESRSIVAAYETAGASEYLVKVGAGHLVELDQVWDRLRSAGVSCEPVRRSVVVRNIKPNA